MTTSKDTRLLTMGISVGKLCAEKNKAYGDSFSKAGDFLRLLYPDGIKPEQYKDALGLVRVFDKQMRIATDKDAMGESPWKDIAGYGVLGATDDAVDASIERIRNTHGSLIEKLGSGEGKEETQKAVQEAINVASQQRQAEKLHAFTAAFGDVNFVQEKAPTSLPLPPKVPEVPEYYPGDTSPCYRIFHCWGGVLTKISETLDATDALDAFNKAKENYSHGYLEVITPAGKILDFSFLG